METKLEYIRKYKCSTLVRPGVVHSVTLHFSITECITPGLVRGGIEIFLACGDFCRQQPLQLDSLDPDHGRQNVGFDLDTNCLAF